MIVRLTRQAESDLREARRWYAEQSPAGLDRELGRAVDRTFRRLRDNPRLYRKVRGQVRRAFMSRFPYGVYYVCEEDAVVVLGIRHFAREPLGLEDEEVALGGTEPSKR